MLALIPDHTRTMPLPLLFPMIVDILADTAQLDFMVALGTHPPLPQDALNRLVGITAEDRTGKYAHIGLLNHEWENPDALTQIGTITLDHLQGLAGDAWHPSLAQGGDVPVRINRKALEYDHIIIFGPTFPHEVVGFSGGAKYLFPGISGPEMIDRTHWLGALITILNTIGFRDTPIRDMIHAAASFITTPITLASMVVEGDGLAGMFVGDHLTAYGAAADLSAQRHIQWIDKPFDRVLSCAPPMYDELWVAGKAMYKLEAAVADGGELIIYAPHLDTISIVHGKYLYQMGYHTRDYFLKQWDKFKHFPLGVIAHSTHVKGGGTFENGLEMPRITVTLASQIPPEDCLALNLGYLDPRDIDPAAWANREAEGMLLVPKAGEMLYRVRS
ncbi:MAG: DUF2088 domain-containing protein [Burkholderiales bacterium]|nr:DUF2088 domain-containing protein [Anaerolineae bacterium]